MQGEASPLCVVSLRRVAIKVVDFDRLMSCAVLLLDPMECDQLWDRMEGVVTPGQTRVLSPCNHFLQLGPSHSTN